MSLAGSEYMDRSNYPDDDIHSCIMKENVLGLGIFCNCR